MVALIYKVLSLFALSFISYVILYTANQKHIAKLLKIATIVSIVSTVTIYFAPLLNRIDNDIVQGKQMISAGEGVMQGINNAQGQIQRAKSSIDDNAIINFGAVPKLQGESIFEIFSGGHLEYPLKGEITQGYNDKNHGLDIAATEGQPIKCALKGFVKEVNKNDIYGNYVVIDHGRGFATLYAHLGEVVVKQNQKLFTRDLIGYASDTGNARGVHLHFEVRYNNKTVDPLKYLK